jgi:hypothetical protein
VAASTTFDTSALEGKSPQWLHDLEQPLHRAAGGETWQHWSGEPTSRRSGSKLDHGIVREGL